MVPGSSLAAAWLFIEDMLVVERNLRRSHEAGGEGGCRRVKHKLPELVDPGPVAVVVEISSLSVASLNKVKVLS